MAVLDGGEEPGNNREKKCQARQRQRAKALIREVMMLRRWITVAVSLAMTGTVAQQLCTVQYHYIRYGRAGTRLKIPRRCTLLSKEKMEKILDRVQNPPVYPDIEALIASGDLEKVKGGYRALTDHGLESIKFFVTSIAVNEKTKVATYQLSRRRKRSS